MSQRLDRARNRLAKAIIDLVLTHIATRRYRAWIEGSIAYGLSAAARDDIEGIDSPELWIHRLARHDAGIPTPEPRLRAVDGASERRPRPITEGPTS